MNKDPAGIAHAKQSGSSHDYYGLEPTFISHNLGLRYDGPVTVIQITLHTSRQDELGMTVNYSR